MDISSEQDKAILVKLAQIALNRVYGANIAEDGDWGPKTQKAYEEFYLKLKTPENGKSTQVIKDKIQAVVNVFETGSTEGNYSNVSIYNDGPDNIRQVSFGRSQTTEFSNLKELIRMYASASGKYSYLFKPYVDRVGSKPSLSNDINFIRLLKDSGSDPVMQKVQDEFFDKVYWSRAEDFFNKNGFKNPLSMLVIFDSIIHGGLSIVRKKFAEKVPAEGGSEEKWISDYVQARYNWLKYHSRKILNNTAKRSAFYSELIEDGNWDLSKTIKLQGFSI